MKKLRYILMCGLLLAAGTAMAQGKMELAAESHNFGTIEERRGPVKADFEFVNAGDMPLTIVSASASCGCTRPEYPKKPIAAGKKGKITVNYNPAGRPGEFQKMVTVKYLDGKAKRAKKKTLKISGVVIPAGEASPSTNP